MKMLTVGGYFPAAGLNTIRKVKEAYERLNPGDRVDMEYVDVVGGPVIARERLVVRAIAYGSFSAILDAHWETNHGGWSSHIGGCRVIRDLYGTDEGEFCAIYFY